MKSEQIKNEIEKIKGRSYWKRGVLEYCKDFCDECKIELTTENLKSVMLNGADNWSQWAYGGCGLMYDEDIARRLCTPSELKRKRNGELQPNSRENWIDVEARAIFQAHNIIRKIIGKFEKENKNATLDVERILPFAPVIAEYNKKIA